jgi:acyl carrier protein
MTRVEIITTTKRFLSEEFEVEQTEIEEGNNLQKTLDLDSLDYVDLVVVIEENLGFKPTSNDFKGIETFSDFFDLAEKKFAETA